MTDIRKALEAARQTEREFVAAARKFETAPKGWPAALVMFHICMWREHLNNALTDVKEGRAQTPPPDNVDETNDAELAGGLGVALTDIAQRADVLLTSLITLYEELGERPFQWYNSTTTTEAVLRTSYMHPRRHFVDYLNQNGDAAGALRLREDAVSDLREFAAPSTVLGAALYYFACQRVVQDQTDEALELLVETFSLRPDLKEVATKDPELEPLHDNAAFKALTKA